MQQFLILFREPDGRKDEHTTEEIKHHRQKVAAWMMHLKSSNVLTGGAALTLAGAVIKDNAVTNAPYTKGDAEIVGGYLLIQQESLQAATQLITTCPILDFGGFAEVRQCM